MSTLTQPASARVATTPLRDWVGPAYLTAAVQRRARQRFGAHPAHVVSLPAFLQPRVAARLVHYLTDDARYRAIHSLRSDNGQRTTTARWLAAPPVQRLYRVREYVAPRRGHETGPNARAFARVIRAMVDAPFLRLLEALTGLRLGACELRVHGLGVGDGLGMHSDRWANRRLAFLIYLSPDWRPEYGGLLTMVGPSRLRTEVPPDYNSLVLFDIAAPTSHFVTNVTRAAGRRRRLTLGGWIDGA